MSLRSLRIGITIGLQKPDESLWINGIKQNALFLAKALKHSASGHEVLLLNTTNVPITSQLPWDLDYFSTVPFSEGWPGLDVVIELGGQVSQEETARLKAQGTRLISYCCGPEYVQNIEAMIFDRPLWETIFINPHYDQLWIIPQVYAGNRGYLQTFRRCPARQVPFVWDPLAIEAVTANFENQGEYRPRTGAKRLAIVEPNIDVLKFCLHPILVAELAFRSVPNRIEFLHVANSTRFVEQNREFAGLMRQLDIVKAQKASFIGRVDTPWFLANYTDGVISHQWGLPLNYFYLECCWQGYPLIHNADLIPELGYYYPHSEIDVGARMLVDALEHHDDNWLNYRDRQRQLIRRFLATEPSVVEAYDNLLTELLAK
ncbi:DUF2827 domain-containing protein [Labrys okinawensis]|uniref:DUF2827 domain-containing protein n=1 Tax=Labrys okinawensis TaxID=346911 RepID=UPI0039BCDDC6